MDNAKLNICSVNCNGLGDKMKRIKIFRWLKRDYKGIMFIQETYTLPKDESNWKHDLGHQYKAFFSHWKSNARGVATIIPKNLLCHIINLERDKEGRFLLVQLNLDDVVYSLLNVYAPTMDNQKEQLAFLCKLETMLNKISHTKMIIGGDFNIVSNPFLDRWQPKTVKTTKAANKLLELKELFNLTDVWRTMNPDLKRYTWRRHRPLQQSRIDLWLTSDTLIYDILKCDIGVQYLSDHNIINLILETKKCQPRGRGYWKMNDSLLEDEVYVNRINALFNTMEPELLDISDKRLAWEYLKMSIRRETVSYSIFKKRKNERDRKELHAKLLELEAIICE